MARSRSWASTVLVACVSIVPSAALAQAGPAAAPAQTPTQTQTPSGSPSAAGGGNASPAGTGTGTGTGSTAGTATTTTKGAGPAADDAAPPSTGPVTGYGYGDKKASTAGATHHAAAVRHVKGPIATLPGFEMLPDGGSRLFVVMSQAVPVDEKKAAGTITYALKGAHVRLRNNENALVTVHFNTPVTRARLLPAGGELHFVVELRQNATPTWKVVNNQDGSAVLQIDFPKGDFLNAPAAPAGAEGAPAEQQPKKPVTKKQRNAPPASQKPR